jgi:hypothetical protein
VRDPAAQTGVPAEGITHLESLGHQEPVTGPGTTRARVRILIGRRSADVRGGFDRPTSDEWLWFFQSFIIASIVE